MTTTQYDAEVKRITDAGGQWPPKTDDTPITRWPGTGRYEPLPCRGCGAACDRWRRWCLHCCEVQP